MRTVHFSYGFIAQIITLLIAATALGENLPRPREIHVPGRETDPPHILRAPTLQAAINLAEPNMATQIRVEAALHPTDAGFLARNRKDIVIWMKHSTVVTGSVTLQDCENVQISGGTLQGGVVIDRCTDSSVSDAITEGGVFVRDSYHARVERNRFNRPGGPGVVIIGCMRGERRERSKGWEYPNIMLGNDVVVADCIFEDVGAVGMASIIVNSSFAALKANRMTNLRGRGIEVRNGSVARIQGWLTNVAEFGILFDTSDGVVQRNTLIDGVRFANGNSIGVGIQSTSNPDRRCQVSLQGPVIRGTEGFGVSCRGGLFLITGTVQGGGVGVAVDGQAEGTIGGIRVTDCTDTAIGVRQTDNKITFKDVKCHNNPGFGILLDVCSDVRFTNVSVGKDPTTPQTNRASYNGSVGGIGIAGSNVKADDLKVSRFWDGFGLDMFERSDMEVHNLGVSGGEGIGIRVDDSSELKGKLTCMKNGGIGIVADGGGVIELNDPAILDNTGGGILADGGSTISVRLGKVSRQEQPVAGEDLPQFCAYGVQVRNNSTVNLNETRLDLNTRAAVRVISGQANVIKCQIRGSRIGGRDRIYEASLDGILVEGGVLTVEDSKFDIHDGTNIRVLSGGQALIKGVTFARSLCVDIASGATADVQGCSFPVIGPDAPHITVARGGRFINNTKNKTNRGTPLLIIDQNAGN